MVLPSSRRTVVGWPRYWPFSRSTTTWRAESASRSMSGMVKGPGGGEGRSAVEMVVKARRGRRVLRCMGLKKGMMIGDRWLMILAVKGKSISLAGDVEGGGLGLDWGFWFGVDGEGGVLGDESFGELAGEFDEFGIGEEVAEAEAGEAGLGGS